MEREAGKGQECQALQLKEKAATNAGEARAYVDSTFSTSASEGRAATNAREARAYVAATQQDSATVAWALARALRARSAV